MPDLVKPGQSATLWCEICLSCLLGPDRTTAMTRIPRRPIGALLTALVYLLAVAALGGFVFTITALASHL
jgi:hypothetical protein